MWRLNDVTGELVGRCGWVRFGTRRGINSVNIPFIQTNPPTKNLIQVRLVLKFDGFNAKTGVVDAPLGGLIACFHVTM
jgi:hypothetical protein